MGTQHSEAEAAVADSGDEYPRSWIWEEDGDSVAGTFVRFSQGMTRDYGPKAILVLLVDGVERSLWLTQTVLFGRVRDEVASRPSKNLDQGERVVLRRLKKTQGEGGRQGYWKFRTLFPDRPEPSVSEILDLEDESIAQQSGEVDENGDAKPAKPSQDDDIPF
jgi:hypothetical protein